MHSSGENEIAAITHNNDGKILKRMSSKNA
jgi:hypothetical protein